MNFYLIGIDYLSASLKIREEISLRRKEILDFWQARKPRETAILSTCNRMEIYGVVKDLDGALMEISVFKQRFGGLFENAYIRFGKTEIFEHLLRLACGLESQLVGELQILQQLKAWSVQGLLPQPLSELLEQILPLAEDIRRQAGLNRGEINIVNIVLEDLKKRIGVKSAMEIIVVGTGKIAQLIALYRPKNIRLHFVSHKRRLQAQLLAERAGGEIREISDLPNLLLTVDSLISATSSPHFVISEKHFLMRSSKRQRPIYLYDLAIPRDIEPQVSHLPGVFLQNLNDLGPVFEQNNQLRQSEISLAKYLATEIINSYKDGLDGANYPSGHAPQQAGNKTI